MSIGKALRLALTLLLFTVGAKTHAVVEASVDRDRVALGDTLTLTIKATGGENLAALQLQPLNTDFQVLQRSSRSNTRIVNGQRESSTELLLTIAPRRAGTLRIPSLQLGRHDTNMILISVGPAPDTPRAGADVIFEAEVDRTQTWVQGQVLLTLRLHQAVNLESRSITDLKLEDAYVHTLSQNSFQRQVDGRPFLITEIRYAIFPEQSGTLTIPEQTFTAREVQPRRSLFDNNNGRLLSRTTQPITLQVRTRPADYPAGATWLPAEEVTVSESWSAPPDSLEVGQSVTRTITLTGRGLQGAQLPPVATDAIDGLKIYPDQPQIEDGEATGSLVGTRRDSAAIIATRAGDYVLPEVRIAWWDTRRERLQYAVIPERILAVTGGATTAPITPAEPIAQAVDTATPTVADSSLAASRAVWVWQLVAVVSTVGWLVTLGYMFLLWQRARAASATTSQALPGDTEAALFRQLKQACAANDPGAVRNSLIVWAAAVTGRSISRLDQVSSQLDDDTLRAMLASLDSALYAGNDATAWDASALRAALPSLRKQLRVASKQQANGAALSLYPSG